MTTPNTERWTRRQAQEFFRLVTTRVPPRCEEFIGSVGAAGGPSLEMERRDIESLVPAWSWYLGWLDAGSPALPRSDPAPTPPWHDPSRRRLLSGEQLWGVDGMACFYADVALRVLPGARWELLDRPKSDVDYYLPVITVPGLRHIEPIGLLYGSTLRALEGAAYVRAPDALSSLLAQARAHVEANVPEGPEPTVADLLDLYERGGKLWLGVDDDLRVMIGDEALDELEHTLLDVPGIRSVERSDTELFVLATDRKPEALRPALIALMERLRDANRDSG